MNATSIAFLSSQIFTVPFLVAYIVGIVLAFNRYPRLGTRALFAGLGFCFFAIGWLIASASMYWLMASRQDGVPVEAISRVVALTGAASYLTQFIGLILVMFAVFDTRQPSIKD